MAAKKKYRSKTTAESDLGEVRVQVPIHADTIEKIDELAQRLGVGRGRMSAMLLEAAIEDHEWVIKAVTSDIMKPLVEVLKGWGKDKKKQRVTQSPKA